MIEVQEKSGSEREEGLKAKEVEDKRASGWCGYRVAAKDGEGLVNTSAKLEVELWGSPSSQEESNSKRDLVGEEITFGVRGLRRADKK